MVEETRADKLPNRALPRRACPSGAAEILLHDDVGRQLRPADRDLDILLLEDFAAVAGDRRGAQLHFTASKDLCLPG